MPNEIPWMTLKEVSRRIQDRELPSVRVTEHMLDRTSQLDPTYRSYATVTPDLAMEAARKADADISQGHHRGVLHGVPLAVKDLCDTAGIPTAAGMPIRREHVPDQDATVVTRLKDAGAVLLGKLQMTEGAGGAHHPRH